MSKSRSSMSMLLTIKKYGGTFGLGKGQVQNGHLYIRYRSCSHKNEAEEPKKLTEYIHMYFPLIF